MLNIIGAGVAASAFLTIMGRESVACVQQDCYEREIDFPILLDVDSVRLVRSIFSDDSLSSLGTWLDKRIIKWGTSPAALVKSYSMSVSSLQLRRRLSEKCARVGSLEGKTLDDTIRKEAALGNFDLRIYANTFVSHDRTVQYAGLRRTFCGRVKFDRPLDNSAHYVEELDGGWFSIIPLDDRNGHFQITLPGHCTHAMSEIENILSRATVIPKPRLPTLVEAQAITAPSLRQCFGKDWIGIGTAAMTLDPLCGLGVASAVRSAILAVAIVRGVLRGEKLEELTSYYDWRMKSTFRRHLAGCLRAYSSTSWNAQWKKEIYETWKYMNSLSTSRRTHKYRLEGFDLIKSL